MIRLIRIGYWRSEREPDLPDPAAPVDAGWDPDEREVVVDHVRGGRPVLHMMGHSPCRLCAWQGNGASELTDGTYLWPEGLQHYVADHDVRLPPAFVAHAVRRSRELEEAALRAHEDPASLAEWRRITG